MEILMVVFLDLPAKDYIFYFPGKVSCLPLIRFRKILFFSICIFSEKVWKSGSSPEKQVLLHFSLLRCFFHQKRVFLFFPGKVYVPVIHLFSEGRKKQSRDEKNAFFNHSHDFSNVVYKFKNSKKTNYLWIHYPKGGLWNIFGFMCKLHVLGGVFPFCGFSFHLDEEICIFYCESASCRCWFWFQNVLQ